MCIVCIANNVNRYVYMYLNTRIFPTIGYARVLLFMFIRRELGGTGTGCLFQFTYCVNRSMHESSVLIASVSSEGSGEPAHMRRLARAFDTHIHKV